MSAAPPSADVVPATSATFAVTLDQNVSRAVQERITTLERQTRAAGLVTGGTVATVLCSIGAAAVIEPVSLAAVVYVAAMVVPVPATVWRSLRRAFGHASLLDQNRDVAFVGADGLVFFNEDGFFVEKKGGFMPWGVTQPVPRRYDSCRYDRRTGRLVLASSHGYGVEIRVPEGWNDADTQRVRQKMDAFGDRSSARD